MSQPIAPTQPLQSLQTLRSHYLPRTCHQMGVCMHPSRSCTGTCEQAIAMKPLAPGVLDGPYPRELSRAAGHTSSLARITLATLTLLACALLGAELLARFGAYL